MLKIFRLSGKTPVIKYLVIESFSFLSTSFYYYNSGNINLQNALNYFDVLLGPFIQYIV